MNVRSGFSKRDRSKPRPSAAPTDRIVRALLTFGQEFDARLQRLRVRLGSIEASCEALEIRAGLNGEMGDKAQVNKPLTLGAGQLEEVG